jgi:hypothetical protein
MYPQQWIVAVSLVGGVVLGLAATFSPGRRLRLALPGAVLLLLMWYELRMDRWEKTVGAPIRIDMFLEMPLMTICLIFGTWQIIRLKNAG